MGQVSSGIKKRDLYLNLAEARRLLETSVGAVHCKEHTALMLSLHQFQIYRQSMNQLSHNS